MLTIPFVSRTFSLKCVVCAHLLLNLEPQLKTERNKMKLSWQLHAWVNVLLMDKLTKDISQWVTWCVMPSQPLQLHQCDTKEIRMGQLIKFGWKDRRANRRQKMRELREMWCELQGNSGDFTWLFMTIFFSTGGWGGRPDLFVRMREHVCMRAQLLLCPIKRQWRALVKEKCE